MSLTSSREFDEACPWETDYAPPTAAPGSAAGAGNSSTSAAPDVSRTRKVSNAGTSSHSTSASNTSDPHCLPIDYTTKVKAKSIDEHCTVNEDDGEGGGGEEEDNNGNDKIFVTNKVNIDYVENVASSSSSRSSRQHPPPGGHGGGRPAAAGTSGGSCPTLTSSRAKSSAANNKGSVDSDNFYTPHSAGGAARRANKTGYGGGRASSGTADTTTSGGCSKSGLRRVDEDILTEMDSLDDTICLDDDIPLLNCERNESVGRKRSQEDSLVMKITRMNLSESCSTTSRRLSGTETIVSRLDSESSETTIDTQHLTLDDDEEEDDGDDDCWINDDVCPWDDESLTPTWL